jgi:peptide/nickel transport system permease protein
VIGFSVAGLSTLLGTAVGAVAGWFGGWVDEILMRLTDLLLIVPGLAVLMIAQKGLGRSMVVMIVILSLLSWHTVARVVRAHFLSLKEREFVEAARATGASAWRIISRQLLPNAVGLIAVNATLVVGGAILAESALSFLNLGLKPPAPSWGAMVAESNAFAGTRTAYLAYFPGLAILLTVLAVNLVGDGLRHVLAPPEAGAGAGRRRPGRAVRRPRGAGRSTGRRRGAASRGSPLRRR